MRSKSLPSITDETDLTIGNVSGLTAVTLRSSLNPHLADRADPEYGAPPANDDGPENDGGPEEGSNSGQLAIL